MKAENSSLASTPRGEEEAVIPAGVRVVASGGVCVASDDAFQLRWRNSQPGAAQELVEFTELKPKLWFGC